MAARAEAERPVLRAAAERLLETAGLASGGPIVLSQTVRYTRVGRPDHAV